MARFLNGIPTAIVFGVHSSSEMQANQDTARLITVFGFMKLTPERLRLIFRILCRQASSQSWSVSASAVLLICPPGPRPLCPGDPEPQRGQQEAQTHSREQREVKAETTTWWLLFLETYSTDREEDNNNNGIFD